MSEQSLTAPEQQIPSFTDLEQADWGRDTNVEATETPSDAVSPADETGTQSQETSQEEELARSRGWVPESEWHGPKERWVDARAYNDRTETVLPLVQKENKKLVAEISALRQQNSEFMKQAQEWQKFQSAQAEAQRALRVDTLRMERKQAIENGDTDALIRVDDELMKMRVAEVAPVSRPAPPAVDPEGERVIKEFISENPVYEDQVMQARLAREIRETLMAGMPLRGRELVDEAHDSLRRRYPDKFNGGQPPMRRHPLGETGGAPTGGRTARGKTWNDLKPENRAALEKFIQTTPGATREGILKSAPPDAFRS